MSETTMLIIQWVITAFPSIIAVLSFVGVVLKIRKEMKETRAIVVDMKNFEAVKSQMTQVLQENYELKQTLNETMTKIDRVKRG